MQFRTKNSVPQSFFALKPNGNACYAGYKSTGSNLSIIGGELSSEKISPSLNRNKFAQACKHKAQLLLCSFHLAFVFVKYCVIVFKSDFRILLTDGNKR